MAKPESFELDHVFVCGPAGEAAIAPIVNAGFRVGINREHPGQGTYNTCFFFDNAYLELFHLRREEDTQSPAIAPLSLSQRLRWRDTDACPFGMALRPAPGNHDCPFATWDYAAPYLPPGVAIPIITPPHRPDQPLLFMSMHGWGPPSAWPAEQRPVIEHSSGRRTITRVEITLKCAVVPPLVAQVAEASSVHIAPGREHHLTAVLDHATARVDLRPAFPLTVHY